MPDNKDESELNDYLQGDSELSRRYRAASKNGPPKKLDDAILAASRKSVNSSPQSVRPHFIQKWSRPLSIAAVLVVCVSLVFTIYEEEEHQLLTEPSSQKSLKDSLPEKIDNNQFRSLSTEQDNRAESENETRNSVADEVMTELPATDAPVLKTEPAMTNGLNRERKQTDTRDVLKNRTLQKPSKKPLAEEGVNIMQDKPAAVMEQEMQSTDALKRNATAAKEKNWLAEITRLWQTGKKEEAMASLERFLEAHPDYPHEKLVTQLPEDLPLEEIIKQ